MIHNICPVCEGTKTLTYKTNSYYGHKIATTKCWACRGTGYVDYKEDEQFNTTRIGKMFATVDTIGR